MSAQDDSDALIWVSVEMRYSTLKRIWAKADEKHRNPGRYLTAVIENIFGEKPKVTRIHAQDHEQLTLTG